MAGVEAASFVELGGLPMRSEQWEVRLDFGGGRTPLGIQDVNNLTLAAAELVGEGLLSHRYVGAGVLVFQLGAGFIAPCWKNSKESGKGEAAGAPPASPFPLPPSLPYAVLRTAPNPSRVIAPQRWSPRSTFQNEWRRNQTVSWR